MKFKTINTMHKFLLLMAVLLSLYSCESEGGEAQTSTVNTEQEVPDSNMPGKAEDPILGIKQNFDRIESGLSSWQKKEIVVDEGEAYPLEITGFYEGASLVKVVKMEIYGHSSSMRSYYFDQQELFFVHEVDNEEASVMGPFTTKEARSYIHEKKLIRVLQKEHTTSDNSAFDMSTIPNQDITDQIENEQETLADYNRETQRLIALLTKTPSNFKDGKWISTDDPKSGIEIKNGKWIMFYEGMETQASDIYDIEVISKLEADEIASTVFTLSNESESLTYALLEYNDETLSMSYLDRGNTLTYKKE